MKDLVSANAPCPRCGIELAERQAARAKLFVCRQCGGAWLPKEIARRVIEHVQGSLPIVIAAEKAVRAASGETPNKRTARCPWDAEPLALATFEGVNVDVCAVHGTWFDAGEVRKIANAQTVNDSSGPPATAPKKSTDPFDVGTFFDSLCAVIDEIE